MFASKEKETLFETRFKENHLNNVVQIFNRLKGTFVPTIRYKIEGFVREGAELQVGKGQYHQMPQTAHAGVLTYGPSPPFGRRSRGVPAPPPRVGLC